MHEIKYHNPDFYESYILGKLSKPDETAFEEHLLFCNHCQNELRLYEKIYTEIKKRNLANEKSVLVKKPTIRLKYTVGIAASILLLIGLASILLLTQKKVLPPVLSQFTQDTVTSQPEPQPENVAEQIIPARKKKKTPELSNSGSYAPSAIYENAIKNAMRAQEIKVLSPKLNDVYSQKDTITFRWVINKPDLTLVIFNNAGEIIFEKSITTPYHFTDTLSRGLYYWQVENPYESLYTGKFQVR